MTLTSDNFATIYNGLLSNIFYYPNYISSPRGLKIKECTNIELHLTNPYSNLFMNSIRQPKMDYLMPELLWYFSGRNDLDFISRYSKFWNKIANEDGTVNSAYGYLLFNEKNEHGITEYEWAYQSLINDKHSRQAILRFNKPGHSYIGNKDFVCTLNGIFHIREKSGQDYLDFTTTMRSQDVWFGIIYDIPFYTLLQQQMLNHLRTSYPELQLGTYRHYVLSEHIYEKDFDAVENMLKYEFKPASLPALKANLIHPNGTPSYGLLSVLDAVENEFQNLTFLDELLNSMYNHSIGKK